MQLSQKQKTFEKVVDSREPICYFIIVLSERAERSGKKWVSPIRRVTDGISSSRADGKWNA